MKARRILYVTGTRADFGLMERTLRRVDADPRLELQIVVTGMHLSKLYGLTVRNIEASGLPIHSRIQTRTETTTGLEMGFTFGAVATGMAKILADVQPEFVVVLGDRGEMLAAAAVAIYQNVPIVHIHGGELSGSVDEPVRHAISKLAHYHFTATEAAKNRLRNMGERESCIFVTGAPGLDGIHDFPPIDRKDWCTQHGFDPLRPVALLIFHPVVQEAAEAGAQAALVLNGVLESGCQVLCLQPNSDAGGSAIRAAIARKKGAGVKVLSHMDRQYYLQSLSVVDLLAGNSSSGIIEAASFQLPAVNIGHRQYGRERSGNVVDSDVSVTAVKCAIRRALGLRRGTWENAYGDGNTSARIVELLATLPIEPELLRKVNSY